MTGVYRSGLLLRPPLALGGHAFTVDVAARTATGPLFPGHPTIWRCLRCHLHTTTPAVHGPCPDRAAALTTGDHP